METALVTGATGHLGNNLVRELLKHNVSVKALVRSTSDLSALSGLPVEIVKGDILAPLTLERAFQGVDTVYHTAALIWVLPGGDEECEKVNVEGTRNVIGACLSAGAKKLIYTGTIHSVKEPPKGEQITEELPFYPDNPRGAYDRSKARASIEVIEASSSKLFTGVLLPTGIVGPNDFKPSMFGQNLIDYSKGKTTAYIDGAYDYVDVRDVAKGHILAAKKAKPGFKYILSGEQMSMLEMYKILEEHTGVPAPTTKLPMGIMKFLGSIMGVYYKITEKPSVLTRYSIETLQSNSNISHELATKELGYSPRSIRQAIIDTANWFKDQGKI